MALLAEAAAKFHTAVIGYQRVRDKNKLARQTKPKIAAFFLQQRDLTIERFKDLEHLFPESSQAKTSKAVLPTNPLLQKGWDAIWDDIAANSSPELKQIITKAEANGLLEGAKFASKSLKLTGFKFDLANPRAVAWFQQNGGSLKYIKGIQATTGDELKSIITNAIDTGQSYTKTAGEISDKFEGMTQARAQLIATNEAAQAYESGSFIAEQEIVDAGFDLEISWENSGDGKVSDGCLENSAVGWIPFGEAFPSSDLYPPRFPGCRCWHITRRAGKGD